MELMFFIAILVVIGGLILINEVGIVILSAIILLGVIVTAFLALANLVIWLNQSD